MVITHVTAKNKFKHMKKVKIIIFLIAIGVATFIFFKDYSKVSNLPEPTYIAFEQQQVVPFFDWSLIGPTGKTKNLYIDQGNVMIIHFWDANNPKSVEELEIFQKLYDDYKTKAQFYFVTSNTQVEVRSFIEKNKFSFPVFFSLSPAPKPIENKVIPSTYVLNKKGRIVIDTKFSANWNSENFRKVLDELVK